MNNEYIHEIVSFVGGISADFVVLLEKMLRRETIHVVTVKRYRMF